MGAERNEQWSMVNEVNEVNDHMCRMVNGNEFRWPCKLSVIILQIRELFTIHH